MNFVGKVGARIFRKVGFRVVGGERVRGFKYQTNVFLGEEKGCIFEPKIGVRGAKTAFNRPSAVGEIFRRYELTKFFTVSTFFFLCRSC